MSTSPTPETDAMIEDARGKLNYPVNPVSGEFARKLERERNQLRDRLFPRCLQSIAAMPSGEVGNIYANDAKACCAHMDDLRTRLENALSDKVIAEKSYKEARVERDEVVKEIAHLKDVLADASKNYRLIEAENLSLNVQINLAREMLNGQEKRHAKEVAKHIEARDSIVDLHRRQIEENDRLRHEIAVQNGHYLKVMTERDQLRAMTTPPEPWMPKPPQNLREDIIRAINCRSAENGSDTPDWILGDFLMQSLCAFDRAVRARTGYYQASNDVPETDPPTTTEG